MRVVLSIDSTLPQYTSYYPVLQPACPSLPTLFYFLNVYISDKRLNLHCQGLEAVSGPGRAQGRTGTRVCPERGSTPSRKISQVTTPRLLRDSARLASSKQMRTLGADDQRVPVTCGMTLNRSTFCFWACPLQK